jgi:Cu/Zn superoxide dismutase
VVVHAQRDDFTTQPSGDPGILIACGEIHSMT